MLTPTPPLYSDAETRLAALLARSDSAYVDHARHPGVVGPAGTHLFYWLAAYEVRAALAEQNPAFAFALLPSAGVSTLAGPGLPLLPTGVLWQVDKPQAGTLTITVDVAGPVTMSVVIPGQDRLVSVPVTQGPTRATGTVAAPADGLYEVRLGLAGSTLVSLFVPVERAEFRRFREDVRARRYGFTAQLPRPGPAVKARLARLFAAEAAARTGQVGLYSNLTASAAALVPAATPIALYPSHG